MGTYQKTIAQWAGISKRQALLYIGHDEEDRRIALSSHPCCFFRAIHTDIAVAQLGSKGANLLIQNPSANVADAIGADLTNAAQKTGENVRLGKTAVFTSDVKDRWAADWLQWPGYSKLWSQLVRQIMRSRDDTGVDLNVIRDLKQGLACFLEKNAARGWTSVSDFVGIRRDRVVAQAKVRRPTDRDYRGGYEAEGYASAGDGPNRSPALASGFLPDGISMAKSLGGGFPIGAFWVRTPYADLLNAGSHGATFGGSPLGCAVALKVLEVIKIYEVNLISPRI